MDVSYQKPQNFNLSFSIFHFSRFSLFISHAFTYLCSMKSEKALSYPPLSLPAADLRMEMKEGYAAVFDPLRRRYVRLTPEEWVRQHFTAFLIGHKGYPAGLLGNEVSLTLNGMTRRCDSVLYGLDHQPRMIIEYKAPTVALTQKVFDQIWRYNTVLRVEWLIVSNGLQHVVCHLDKENGTYAFLAEVPMYEEL